MQCVPRWVTAFPDSLSVGLLVGSCCVLLLKAAAPIWQPSPITTVVSLCSGNRSFPLLLQIWGG